MCNSHCISQIRICENHNRFTANKGILIPLFVGIHILTKCITS